MAKFIIDNVKINTPTQQILDIVDVVNGILILKGGNYCRIIEVQPVNFALLNPEEQGFLIRKFAGFINSLDFPIQILIDNKKLVMQDYLIYLDKITSQQNLNPQLHAYLEIYRQFVNNILTQKTVFDKKFFIIVKYHSQVYNPKATPALIKQQLDIVTNHLDPKASHIINNFKQMGLEASILDTPEIVKTFYRYYNPEDKDIKIQNNTIAL